MSWRDPGDVPERERTQGHEGLKLHMDKPTRDITEASGQVHDHRRIVSFIYLLLRDNVPFGRMATVMRHLRAVDDVRRQLLFSGIVIGEVERLVDRLVDDEFNRERMTDWLALVFKHSDHPDRVPTLVDIVPGRDDIETVFSNGWAANYAKYLADELQHARA